MSGGDACNMTGVHSSFDKAGWLGCALHSEVACGECGAGGESGTVAVAYTTKLQLEPTTRGAWHSLLRQTRITLAWKRVLLLHAKAKTPLLAIRDVLLATFEARRRARARRS